MLLGGSFVIRLVSNHPSFDGRVDFAFVLSTDEENIYYLVKLILMRTVQQSFDANGHRFVFIMDELCALDKVNRFNFSSFEIDFNSSCLKFPNDGGFFVLTDEEKCDLMTFQPTKETAILCLDSIDVELHPDQIYFLTPVPENFSANEGRKLTKKCNTRRYISITNVTQNVSNVNDQMYFSKKEFFLILDEKIGSDKLELRCWPFTNISLNKYLDECKSEFIIVLEDTDFVVFDESKDDERETSDPFVPEDFIFPSTIQTNTDDEYEVEKFYPIVKKERLESSGWLFKEFKNSRLKKEIKYLFQTYVSNGSSLTTGENEKQSKIEDAFIIFNQYSEVKEPKEVVLPCSDDCEIMCVEEVIF